MGTTSIEKIADRLKTDVRTIYRDLADIRLERDLIHPDLINHVAEEQFNRLASLVRLNYKDTVSMREKVEFYELAIADGAEDLTEVKKQYNEALNNFWKTQYQYRLAEDQLTRFLKATRLYDPDINIQLGGNTQIVVQMPDMGGVVPDKKKAKEVNERPKK